MAFQLPSFYAAGAYAQTFDPVERVKGFKNIKSDVATNALASIPQINFEAETEMAKEALKQAAATKRQDMVNEASLELEELKQKGDKRDRLMAALGSAGLGGGGFAGAPPAPTKSVMAFDPLQHAANAERIEAWRSGTARQGAREIRAALVEAIPSPPSMPKGSGSAGIQAPETQVPSPGGSGRSASVIAQPPKVPKASVELSADDVKVLQREAKRQGVTVQQLLEKMAGERKKENS